jgi:hypothetical protein
MHNDTRHHDSEPKNVTCSNSISYNQRMMGFESWSINANRTIGYKRFSEFLGGIQKKNALTNYLREEKNKK